MALDMYVFLLARPPITAVDFPIQRAAFELHGWRQHPDLHRWMEALYRHKGGRADPFKRSPVMLTLHDILALESDILRDRLPRTASFIFGRSDGTAHEKLDDLAFIRAAKAALAEGFVLAYAAHW